MAPPVHKRIKRSMRSIAIQALVRIFAFVPLRPALAFATLLARVGWVLARETRRQMLAHLAIAFPEKTQAERGAIAKASLVHLAGLAAEVATLPGWRARLPRFVSVAPDAEEVVWDAMGRGRGLVYVAGHVGNWELMAQRVPMLGGWPAATIAKATPDSRLNALIERARADGGVETLWREDPATARSMIRCFRENKVLGILIDQDTSVQGLFVPTRPGDGHEVNAIEVNYEPEAADREAEVVRLTAACTVVLEGAICRSPAEWVWMHEPWKTVPAIRPDEAPQAKAVPKTAELSGG